MSLEGLRSDQTPDFSTVLVLGNARSFLAFGSILTLFGTKPLTEGNGGKGTPFFGKGGIGTPFLGIGGIGIPLFGLGGKGIPFFGTGGIGILLGGGGIIFGILFV